MAGKSVCAPPAATCKRLLMLLRLVLLYVCLILMECMHASNSVQALNGFRAELVHIDSLLPANTTSTERLTRAVQRSNERLKYFMHSADKYNLQKDYRTPLSINPGPANYVIEVSIGTPPIEFISIMDPGTDLVWSKCSPCLSPDCSSSPIYDPLASSTYSKLDCQSPLCQPLEIFSCDDNGDCQYLYYEYADESNTAGILANEIFYLSDESLPQITFGCSTVVNGFGIQVGGVVGFGRGPLSFVSQLGPTAGGKKFSYCLIATTSYGATSPLFIGDSASISASSDVSSTPIGNGGDQSLYYVTLQGISVGGQLLEIPDGTFDVNPTDGSGGVVMDCGTTITYLPQIAYDAVKEELSASINLPQADGDPYGLDACYNQQGSSNPTFPDLTFHFDGADYDVPKENYLFPDTTSDVVCLAMLPVPLDVFDTSMIGAVMQQNHQILFDDENQILSFAQIDCATL